MKILHLLISNGAYDYINFSHHSTGLTAVVMAAQNKNIDAVKYLILYGATVGPEHRKYFSKPDIDKDIVYARMYHDVIDPTRRGLEEVNKIMLERSSYNSGSGSSNTILAYIATFTIVACCSIAALFLTCIITGTAIKLLLTMCETLTNEANKLTAQTL